MAYNNPGPGAGDDMYADAAPGGEARKSESTPKEEGQGETALVPKSLCPDMQVGEEMVVKIVAVHDDQYEVAYAPEKGAEKEEGYPEPASKPGESEMASLME